jgi:hypothetical protein
MSDFTDDRRGAYDPISKDGLPQPPRVKDKVTPHQKEQWGADVRPEPLPGTEPVLPERLLRPATSPLNPRTGRRPAD